MTLDQCTASARDLLPLMFVEHVDRSLEFYCDRLGVNVVEKWKPEGKLAWWRLLRGGATLMLQQACEVDGPAAGRGRGVGLFFLCDNFDSLYAEFCAKGLNVEPPQVASYGMNQLFLKDPDGYQLCFQNPTEPA